jgi:hypothetical protein
VQREVTSYARAAQAALSAVELISEALVREKHAAQLFDGAQRNRSRTTWGPFHLAGSANPTPGPRLAASARF